MTFAELRTLTEEGFKNYTTEELTKLYGRLSKGMELAMYDLLKTKECCEIVKAAYWKVNEVLDNRYEEENADKVRAYYKEHFEGKAWEEVNKEDWDFYSDWYKDTFGRRPHF